MNNVCDTHKANPVKIYGACIGCEIVSLQNEIMYKDGNFNAMTNESKKVIAHLQADVKLQRQENDRLIAENSELLASEAVTFNNNTRLNSELNHWKDEALKQARLYTEKNEKAHQWKSQAEALFETIETSIYELERLERNLEMPERGYVRNSFNSILRTLKEGVKDNG